ncbi:MAG TPA: xanthine dehydrogenase family protein molybdopterin-binding subunit [Chloroflexota bacterium]|nr:xanthine dehydrogenase family protein molybdopterin-binding subunit [Chloroflexota bacterium]
MPRPPATGDQLPALADGEGTSVVGHNVPRVDAIEKVTGTAQYVADVRLPGMLEGRILRSPYPHARIRSVDTSRAERLPGVIAVVTGEDTPKRKWGSFQKDQYPLAVDKVRYVGDEVAAVAAIDEATAEEALSLIDVDYELLPAVFDPEEAMRPNAPLIHDDKPGNLALHFVVVRGDPDAKLLASDLVLEDTFETRIQWHAAMETIGSLAQFSPSGKLTVYMNTATIFMARTRIAWALDLNMSDVRVIQTAVGGAFGGKSCDDNNAMICSLLAMKAGRPVRIINSREDEFLSTRPRPAMKLWVRMGFMNDGTITAKDLKVIADNGAYSAKGAAVAGVTALRHDTMYLYKDVRSELYVVHTNKIGTGAFRGFGNPEAAFAIDQMIDMAAERLGLDPVEMTLKNTIGPNHTSIHGNRVLSCELKECVRQAADMVGWGEHQALCHSERSEESVTGTDASPEARHDKKGIGLASSVHVSGKRHFGDYDGSSMVVNVNLDGKVHIWSGEGETGPGANTVLAQIAAEELGVPFADVSVSVADTDTTTYAQGSYASRSAYIAGNAVRDAAQKVRAEILELAAGMLEALPEDLAIEEGVISVKGNPAGKTVTVGDVAMSALYRRGGKPISALGIWDPPSEVQDEHRYGNESGSYNFCSHAVELAVDPQTGQFKLLNYVAASDAGTVIFPMGAEGQNEGGAAQGLGYAFTEEMHFDDGRPLGPNFGDYKLPCIADMPPFRQVFVPSYEPTGPLGAKGIGEIGLDPTAPAIANAIYDAVGVRIKTLPITPEKVLWALQEKERTGHDGSARIVTREQLLADRRPGPTSGGSH